MILECKNLSCFYGTYQAVANVSFSINAGEYLCVVGANGSGKSTLVKTILGLNKNFTGSIIKEKKSFSLRDNKNLLLSILFSIISLGIGFIIAFYGGGNSYIETELITAIITLFGFGLTATVFVYQAFEKSNSNEKKNVKERRLE